MKSQTKKIDVKSVLLGALVGACFMVGIAAATSPDASSSWEYTVVQGTVIGQPPLSLGNEVNRHVAQGWEYVSASASRDQYGFAVMRRKRE
jgi:hypothetical protein